MAIKDTQSGRRNLLLRLRPALRWLFRLRGSARAVAGGLALGMFLALTPTVGVQVILALALATLFNLNRPAAVLPVWITNPVTMPAIYSFNYWLGCFFWSGPPVGEVYRTFFGIAANLARLDIWDVSQQIKAFMTLGREIAIPLIIGSTLAGLVAAAMTYAASLWLLQWLLQRRERKRRSSRYP